MKLFEGAMKRSDLVISGTRTSKIQIKPIKKRKSALQTRIKNLSIVKNIDESIIWHMYEIEKDLVDPRMDNRKYGIIWNNLLRKLS